ncbi:MAG: hypothetical protein N3E46_07725 [Gemmataceae bacterium]|nr:hypothetical protein [Gemmataceae bacterium]
MTDSSEPRERTCRQFRRAVLALSDPRFVPSRLRQHSQQCADCRVWAEQAAELESALSQLRVPPSSGGKAHLLAQLGPASGAIPSSFCRSPAPESQKAPRQGHGKLRSWLMTAGALAAALVLAVLYYAGSGSRPQREVASSEAPYPFLQQLVAHDVALARANTPGQRLQALSALADTVAQETQALARIASPEELRELVRWYDKVVERGLIQQAEEWAAQMQTERERQQLLEMAGRLAATAQATENLLDTVPPHAQLVLRQLAQTAREGEHKIKRLSGT